MKDYHGVRQTGRVADGKDPIPLTEPILLGSGFQYVLIRHGHHQHGQIMLRTGSQAIDRCSNVEKGGGVIGICHVGELLG